MAATLPPRQPPSHLPLQAHNAHSPCEQRVPSGGPLSRCRPARPYTGDNVPWRSTISVLCAHPRLPLLNCGEKCECVKCMFLLCVCVCACVRACALVMCRVCVSHCCCCWNNATSSTVTVTRFNSPLPSLFLLTHRCTCVCTPF